MKVESALAGFTLLGHTEQIGAGTFSCGISTGDGRYHDERKGWGTFSSDGKSIMWDDWRPPTEAELKDREFDRWWRTTDLMQWVNTESVKWFNGWFDKQLAKQGSTRKSFSKCLLDVINSAPPMRLDGPSVLCDNRLS